MTFIFCYAYYLLTFIFALIGAAMLTFKDLHTLLDPRLV